MNDHPAERPSVYQEGYDSFDRGLPRDNCPYPPDSEDREDWLRGWTDAASDQPLPP